MELIKKYFELTDRQCEQYGALYLIYKEWNDKINVISRKDFESLYLKHVLHSLAIAKVCSFDSDARVCDVGCGGGFPTVPLAILFPEVEFTAVDSIGKKIMVVKEVISALGLQNVTPLNCRIEQVDQKFDYIVSRAVADMSTFLGWTLGKIEKGQKGTLPNGVLCLKGGELAEELALAQRKFDVFEISALFEEEFFATKRVLYTKK